MITRQGVTKLTSSSASASAMTCGKSPKIAQVTGKAPRGCGPTVLLTARRSPLPDSRVISWPLPLRTGLVDVRHTDNILRLLISGNPLCLKLFLASSIAQIQETDPKSAMHVDSRVYDLIHQQTKTSTR